MDEQARGDFRSYVAARSPALLRTAYLLTGNRADAEDLLQTAVAKTYLAWGRIRERAMVVLRHYEDLSEAETAAGMGVSVGTVKSTTSRALGKLRDDELPAALALLIPADAVALPDDLLLVVPEPSAAQVLYSPDGSSEPQPVEDQGTEAAVLIERAPGASGDRLLVLDGEGDPERPACRGTVADLLATS